MTTKHAVLGLLMEGPSYPYQIASRIEQRLGPTWSTSSGHVGQVIGELEQKGHVRRTDRGDKRLPKSRRQIIALTEAGVAAFGDSFEETVQLKLPRRSIQAQLTFAGEERLQDIPEKIDAYQAECARQLEELLSRYNAAQSDELPIRADHLMHRVSLSADVMHIEAEMRWCAHVREMVSLLSAREAIWPSLREANASTSEQGARNALFERLAKPDRGSEESPEGGG